MPSCWDQLMRSLQICVLLLVLVAIAFTGCDRTESIKQTDSAPVEVETNQLAKNHFLIDVRSQKEWDEGHLETAVHIPHTEIVEGIKKVTDDKSAKIYFY